MSRGQKEGLSNILHNLEKNTGFSQALIPTEREALFDMISNTGSSQPDYPTDTSEITLPDREQLIQDRGGITEIVGDTARGVSANRILPQRFRLEPARGTTVTGIRDTHAGKTRGTPPRPVGAPVVRVDRPHGRTNYPHINIETSVPDPHYRISARALRIANRLARGAEAFGRVARPVAVVTDTLRLGRAIYEDRGLGKNTARTAASVAGGWSGAFAVGWGGAKVGAAIGSLGGPVGTAIGGVVGGLAGAIGGAFAGSWLAEKLTWW